MVLMTDVGWVQLMEKHLVQMTELNSTHVLENPKERRLVCLSAGLMVVQMVQMMESGLVHLMEMLWAQDLLMETRSACLKAGLMAAQKDVTMVQKT